MPGGVGWGGGVGAAHHRGVAPVAMNAQRERDIKVAERHVGELCKEILLVEQLRHTNSEHNNSEHNNNTR